MPVATQTSPALERQRSVKVEAAPPHAVDDPAQARAGASLEPPAAPGQSPARSGAAGALIAWLNTQARQHLRPGCRIAVVGSEAGDLARELTRRGYDATALAPDAAGSLRSRFDFVVAHAPQGESAYETLRLATSLPRAHGGLVALGADDRPPAVGAVLEAAGFAPAPGQGAAGATTCWRRGV